MESQVRQLCEAIVDNGIKNTNFFNGRLLAAEDLQVEQQAQRQRESLLGTAVGPGIVRGLEVSLDGFQVGKINGTLKVTAGLAINASGQALYLPDDVQVAVAQQQSASAGASTGFGQCATDLVLPSSIGIYLLVLSPASDFRGSAPLSGLGQNGSISGCGKRFDMEGVQFRLVKVTLDGSLGLDAATIKALQDLLLATNLSWNASLPFTDAANLSKLRSGLAYLCLGAPAAVSFAQDPFQQILLNNRMVSAFEPYGLVERMVQDPAKPLSGDDVPLALVYWTTRGVRFVDNWSVRRRTAQRFSDGPWGYAFGERRIREGEAMIMQFDDQMQSLLNPALPDGFPKVTAANLQANLFFPYLPPFGFLRLDGTGLLAGIRPEVFFNGMNIRDLNKDPLFMEGAGLVALMREAVQYPPIDTTTQELTWLYQLRENQQVYEKVQMASPMLYLVFTNGHMPYRGKSRFELNYFDYSNYV